MQVVRAELEAAKLQVSTLKAELIRSQAMRQLTQPEQPQTAWLNT